MTYENFLNSKFSKGLSKSQMEFFKYFLNGSSNLLLTGPAGTGKSYVISRLSELCESESIHLSKTASTGIAAIGIGAQTVHSFMGIGLADCDLPILIRKVRKNKPAVDRIEACRTILIDEASMISGETFDKICGVFRHFKSSLPRFIVCGDWLQLPPVFKDNKLFAFESSWWGKLNFTNVQLKEIIRQDAESDYAKFLQRVRVGDKSDLSLIEDRMLPAGAKIPEGSIVVFSKNIDVDDYNDEKLEDVPGKAFTFYSEDEGVDPHLSALKKNCLAPEALTLKVGAQVMALKNTTDGEVVNGNIGVVSKIDPGGITVKFDFGNYTFGKEVWKLEESFIGADNKTKTKLLASREQFPLRLAYAITCHKSQGITCDKITVDLSNCFAPGQCYVALSRARSVEGLHILNFHPRSIKVDEKCLEFYRNL